MKKKTYTYNPEKIGEPGVDRMRFEIGDTMVEGEQESKHCKPCYPREDCIL